MWAHICVPVPASGMGIVEPPWKKLDAVEIMPQYQNYCNGASNASKGQLSFCYVLCKHLCRIDRPSKLVISE